MEKKNDFSKGSIPWTITRMAIPMIGAQVINALYSLVDRMYISRIADVGELALTGVGVTFPFLLLVSGFAMLAGMGGSPLCSIARGEGRDDYAERVMGNAFVLLLVFSVIITTVALLVRRPVLYAFGASDNTFPYADQYVTIYLAGSVFVMMSLGMNPFINAQGFTNYGMITVACGAIANILLDPLFIFVFDMGIAGAAWATILSQAISASWVLLFLTGKKCILRLRREYMRLDFAIIRRILALGVSTFTMNMTDCVVQIVCNSTLQTFGGDIYVGAMTIISSVRQIVVMALNGFTQGMKPVVGYNYGAKRYDRVRQSIRFTTVVCLLYATGVCILMETFPEPFLRIFTENEEWIRVGIKAMRIYFCAFFVMGLQMCAQNSFVALGKSVPAIIFSILRKAVIVAPLAYILPRATSLGVWGVFAAEPVSDVIGPSACYLTFMLTVWPKLKNESPGQSIQR